MLQKMQKTVEVEAEKEKELFDKFMCYCKTGSTDLAKSIAEAESKATSLPSEIEEAEAKLGQLKEDLKKAQVDRSSAKTAMDEATALRQKEAAEYAKTSTELKTNIAALAKATAAISKGMGNTFLQTDAAQVLKNLAMTSTNLVDADRQDLASWLSGTTETGEATTDSGAIVGILKQMSDTMAATLADTTATETSGVATYDALMKAKTKEVNALTEAIEKKTGRVGELGIDIVQKRADLTDSEESLLEDKKFLAELAKSCSTKEAEWAIIVKNRNEEILALSETIKILNDDDALEIFKKTLPGGSALVQLDSVTKSARDKVLALLQQVRDIPGGDRSKVDFILLAIRGKNPVFEKVIKMIDDMVVLLKTEQDDDEHKKEYCEMQFDFTDDKKKELDREVSDLETAIADAKEGLATCKTDMDNLVSGVAALDKSVAEATAQRQEENSDFQSLMASDAQAKELLEFAKNRLNKFYNPKLYKPPAASFVQISSHDNKKADPGPAPEAPAAYEKKSGETNGVIAMIDTLVKELDTEMTTAQTEEKLAQEEYTELMATSSEKKRTDMKTLAEKEALKAQLESTIAKKDQEHKDTVKELMATEEYISSLHAECDWLLKYFDMRKEARTAEIDNLKKAKAILSGADFSLLQTKDSKFLGRF